MPGDNNFPARHSVAGRGSEVLQSQFEQGASRPTTYHELASLPSEASLRAQPRASTSTAPRPPTAEKQAGKPASRTEPAIGQRATQAQSSIQEEGSGYLSTESDSDTGTNKKTQRKAASAGAQTARDCKGHGRQMITMAFLEEGGYFDVPIQVASARLGLGVTTLKRVCRAGNMKRWPFRKRNSLGRLIDRTKQVLDDGTGQDNMQKLAALQVLEKQRQVMRSCQSKDMDEKIKSYRQAIFKMDHAERAQRKRGEFGDIASQDQSPQVSKLNANTVAQHSLPSQERLQAAQIPAEEILAQLAQNSQACVQH